MNVEWVCFVRLGACFALVGVLTVCVAGVRGGGASSRVGGAQSHRVPQIFQLPSRCLGLDRLGSGTAIIWRWSSGMAVGTGGNERAQFQYIGAYGGGGGGGGVDVGVGSDFSVASPVAVAISGGVAYAVSDGSVGAGAGAVVVAVSGPVAGVGCRAVSVAANVVHAGGVAAGPLDAVEVHARSFVPRLCSMHIRMECGHGNARLSPCPSRVWAMKAMAVLVVVAAACHAADQDPYGTWVGMG